MIDFSKLVGGNKSEKYQFTLLRLIAKVAHKMIIHRIVALSC